MHATRKAPKSRPERKVKLVEGPDAEVTVYTVRLTVGSDVDLYDVCPALVGNCLPVYLWKKVLPSVPATCAQEPYQVDVGNEFGDSCTCKGGKYHGHCKHIDATRALVAAGKLPNIHEESQ